MRWAGSGRRLTSRTGYEWDKFHLRNRDKFLLRNDADHERCGTRKEALIAEAHAPAGRGLQAHWRQPALVSRRLDATDWLDFRVT
jgi:hypothetical protein